MLFLCVLMYLNTVCLYSHCCVLTDTGILYAFQLEKNVLVLVPYSFFTTPSNTSSLHTVLDKITHIHLFHTTIIPLVLCCGGLSLCLNNQSTSSLA